MPCASNFLTLAVRQYLASQHRNVLEISESHRFLGVCGHTGSEEISCHGRDTLCRIYHLAQLGVASFVKAIEQDHRISHAPLLHKGQHIFKIDR